MEISYQHNRLGFIRFVNITEFRVQNRVLIFYIPDIQKYHIEPLSQIYDIDIEGALGEQDGIFVEEQ